MLYPDVTLYIKKNIYSLALREIKAEPKGYRRFLKIAMA